MQPVMFLLSGPLRNRSPAGRLGAPPAMCGVFLLPAVRLLITGVTKDSAGAVLGSCTVSLYRTADDAFLERVMSDATTGAYAFSSVGPSETYYVVAYKPGAPDVAGTTMNTLTGT